MDEMCRVYWGSHGCRLVRGHDGDCECVCADKEADPLGALNVGRVPYYGPDTEFYGEDVAARGLPALDAD